MKTKLSILLGISALAFLLVAAPVMAAEVNVTSENSTTGADSDNNNDYTVVRDVTLDVDNDGDVDNDVDVDADTGDNEQNRNTTGGDLETGTVEASGEWTNVLNEAAGLCGCPVGSDGLTVEGDFSNDTTGADSDNNNTLTVDANLDVTLNNLATINNDLDFDADRKSVV